MKELDAAAEQYYVTAEMGERDKAIARVSQFRELDATEITSAVELAEKMSGLASAINQIEPNYGIVAFQRPEKNADIRAALESLGRIIGIQTDEAVSLGRALRLNNPDEPSPSTAESTLEVFTPRMEILGSVTHTDRVFVPNDDFLEKVKSSDPTVLTDTSISATTDLTAIYPGVTSLPFSAESDAAAVQHYAHALQNACGLLVDRR